MAKDGRDRSRAGASASPRRDRGETYSARPPASSSAAATSSGPDGDMAGTARMSSSSHSWWARATAPLAAALLLLVACEGAAEGRPPAVPAALDSALDRRDDPTVREARQALADGRPFLATQLLTPALDSPERRTADVVLLAATAAAAWEGWATVQRLLNGEPWLDAQFAGAGRELLARAALARGADSAAAAHAERAVGAAGSDVARGTRLVLLARALDRRDRLAAAADAYARAADLLPRSADWLRLRAAGVVADSARRQALYGAIGDSLVLGRVPLVEAQARERTGDFDGAARAYAATGDSAAALRTRLVAADSARRTDVLPELRASLARLVTERRGSSQARAAAELLRERFAPLSAGEELAVARTLAQSGPAELATRAYAAAARLSPASLDADDRLAWANLLFRVGRYDDAATHYARVPLTHARGGDAAYGRARAVLRDGRVSEARRLLRAIPASAPNDAAARALYLLADLATDEGRDDAARSAFRDLARRFPTSGVAARARFQAAIVAVASGQHHTAALELDTLARRYPRSAEALGALYWAGRSWARLGDSAQAAARWRDVVAREPLSYYAVLSARRLGGPWWAPAADAQPRPAYPDLAGALARVDELRDLGLDPEAEREIVRVAGAAQGAPARMVAPAAAFPARGLSSRGITLGTAALRAGAPADVRTYRTLYPLVHRDVLVAESAEHRLDPALVAALIRQESNFQAGARSPADARGLMQLLPSVGRSVARALDFPVWEDALLYQPDVNVRLGTAHLAGLVRQYDALPHVLAAYNAGGSRVPRWRAKRGAAADPELFAERIPYDETRDYVRIVERNRAIYTALYDWE